MDALDVALVCISLALLVAYHVVYLLGYWRDGVGNLGVNLQSRHAWALAMLSRPDGGGSILSVQTMRNTITSSALYATSSSTIAFFAASRANDEDDGLRKAQLYALAGVLAVTFLNFIVVIKSCDHVGFLISAMPHVRSPGSKGRSKGNGKCRGDDVDADRDRGDVDGVDGAGGADGADGNRDGGDVRPLEDWRGDVAWEDMSQAEREAYALRAQHALGKSVVHQMLGIRGFYFAVLIMCWIASPVMLLVGTLLLLGFMFSADHSFHSLDEVAGAGS